MTTNHAPSTPEDAVVKRYSAGAQAREAALCCPVTFDPRHLKVLPDEIIERDYGCGDPTAYVREGDVVLDLGSGGGKVCWIASQITGPNGRVIGVDMNTEMLALARQHHATIAERIGYDNVTFHRGMIQDLKLDVDVLAAELSANPVDSADAWVGLRLLEERLREESPMIADDSVDVVLSNCVLNLVRPEHKARMFEEIYRVVKNGGRVAISDIVSDEDIPLEMQQDADLWSGCISGAYREDLFLEAFADAGFHGIEIVKRDAEPWQTVNGIEFRSITVQAFKGKAGICLERDQAVVYKGPFSAVRDDDGHTYYRGERMAVCDKTFRLLQREPYAGMFEPIEPRIEIPLEQAKPFDCAVDQRRHARQTKGQDYDATTAASDCCGPADCC
ncbi:MAG: methyltransferase domain-containing protein [Planctomycetes bacterium]|nr:methyltransferase domain-containing protein [Planctomycetota bacterium]